MKVGLKNKDGSLAVLAVTLDTTTQLFDMVSVPRNDGSGNLDLFLVTLRNWSNGVLSFQVASFDGSPQDRLRIMRMYGYCG